MSDAIDPFSGLSYADEDLLFSSDNAAPASNGAGGFGGFLDGLGSLAKTGLEVFGAVNATKQPKTIADKSSKLPTWVVPLAVVVGVVLLGVVLIKSLGKS